MSGHHFLFFLFCTLVQQTVTTIQYECNFEENLCDWTIHESVNSVWRRRQGASNGIGSHPWQDHTTGSAMGYYLHVEPLGFLEQNHALISTPAILQKNTTYCVSLYYILTGSTSNALHISTFIDYSKLHNVQSIQLDATQEKHWAFFQTAFKSGSHNRLMFEAHLTEGDIAIDDVRIKEGGCTPLKSVSGYDSPDVNSNRPLAQLPFRCNFEKDNCGFSMGTGNHLWKKYQGMRSYSQKGPNTDHTYRNKSGHYLYATPYFGAFAMSTSPLVSPLFSGNDSMCLQFWYYMDGTKMDKLSISYRNETKWSITGDAGYGWNVLHHQIPPGQDFEITVEAGNYQNQKGYIAVDDFWLQNGTCPKFDICTFEEGKMCSWSPTGLGSLNWSKKSGENQNGPHTDHTERKSTGKYLFLDAKSAKFEDSRAVLSSQSLNVTERSECFQFWYHMKGNVGQLVVYKQGERNTDVLWSILGNQGVGWNNGKVKIQPQPEKFYLIIEGIVGTNNTGGIALDDLSFSSDECTTTPEKANMKPVVRTTKRSTTHSKVTFTDEGMSKSAKVPAATLEKMMSTTPNLNPVTESFRSCKFTNDFCNWTVVKGQTIQWIRHKKGTPTGGTGPNRDHTNGHGNFIYIETSNSAVSGDRSQLVSPSFQVPAKQTWCLSFWYHMYGDGIGTLSVIYNGTSNIIAWQKSKSQGRNWLNGRVNIRGSQKLQVIFQANKGRTYKGDIALDDISITPGQCKRPTSSELSFCDFESPCSLLENVKSSLRWQITEPSLNRSYVDHTYKSALGDFIYVNLTNTKLYETAKFNIPIPAKKTVCVEFFYRTIGSFNGRLSLFKLIRDRSYPLLRIDEKGATNDWTFSELEVYSDEDSMISFYVLSGSKPNGIIAVDDIELKNNHCKPKADCTFEGEHLCHWKNLKTNRHDWLINSGATDSSRTGPTSDHTKGNQTGNYIYIEASNLRNNEKVRLVSPLLTNNGNTRCFNFWYHMYGNNIEHLSVYIQGSDLRETLMWSLRGAQGRIWKNGRLPLITSEKSFRIIIEGSSTSYRGDIALDDFTTIESSCSFSPSWAQQYKPTSTAAPPTTIKPIGFDDDELCTFEKGMCNWLQSDKDDFQWKLWHGYTSKTGIGPMGDHTSGSGHYMYVDTNGQRYKSKAQLYLEYNPLQNSTRCLSFWYNMRGQHVDNLNVYILHGEGATSSTPEWTKSSDQGPNWNQARIEFDEMYMEQVKIIIEGVKGYKGISNIAIDDVAISKDSCHETYGECNFESRTICGYKFESKSDLNWIRRSGYSPIISTGPTKDHTYGSINGHYMYIPSRQHKPNQTAYLISPIFEAQKDDQCLQFYYNVYGRDAGMLNIKLRIHKTTVYDTDNYLQIKGDQQKGWNLGMVEIPKLIDNKFQIIFEGVIGKGQHGDIAIDDIQIAPGECEVGGDCDFDHGRCTWKNMGGNAYYWLLGSGLTSSDQTGPTNDHTFQNAKGFYLYIDASYLRKGDKSRYISQVFPALYSEKRCIEFWYNMNGYGIGILRILTKFATGTNTTIWQLSRNQGDQWFFAQAPIQSYTPYQIIIESEAGRNFQGDIAIDDIVFKESNCGVAPHTAAPNQTDVPIPTGIPPVKPETSKPFNCTFDKGLCGWSQDQHDNSDWLAIKGSTPSRSTGPRSDHTGNGYYLYIEASDMRYGDKARVVSPLVKSVGMVCVGMYYHMYGSNIGTLNVYASTGDNSQKIFTKSRTQGYKWHQALIEFQTQSPFKIIVEGTHGRGYNGDIAIDDVSIHEGLCQKYSNIGRSNYYNFERGIQLQQLKSDNFQWYRYTGYQMLHGSLPTKDHTYNSTRGHYMGTRGGRSLKTGDKAILSVPMAFSKNPSVCVRFWYYLSGKNPGSLVVQYVSDKDSFKSAKALWTRKDDQGKQWNEATVNIDGHTNTHIQVEFVAIVGTSNFLNIAIDDVRLNNEACTVTKDTCGFEKGNCQWRNKPTDDFDWIIQSGKYASIYGPTNDHTYGSQSGSYLYLEPIRHTKYDATTNQEAVIQSQQYSPASSKKCFEFYFYYNKAKNSSLEIFCDQPGFRNLMWRLSTSQGDKWIKGQAMVEHISKSFRVNVKGIIGPEYDGDIALDDMKFTNLNPCKTLPESASPKIIPTPTPTTSSQLKIPGFNCTFDQNFCGWKNTRSSLNWKRQKGSTRNTFTGPSKDHSGGGYYIFVESSFFSGLFSRYADLISPKSQSSQQVCIKFYYHMYGNNIKSLELMLNQKGTTKTVWSKNGPQGNKWIQGSVKVDLQTSSYVILRARSGWGSSGDIAVDDITINSGDCQEEISSSINCTFESSDICRYSQDKQADFQWKRYSGYGSPFKDHTKNSVFGHFMGDSSSPTNLGKIARLWTPKFSLKDGKCLKFWYRMTSNRAGTLKVHVTSLNDVRRMGGAIWIRRGFQSYQWLEEYIPLPNFSEAYVIFESLNGQSVIGIDDVSLLKSCPEPGDCHFEIGSCGWYNDQNNTINWERMSGRDISRRDQRVIKDRTYDSVSGSMMYIGVLNTKSSSSGNLVSISFDATSRYGLCVKFWYIIYGQNLGQLSVIMQKGNQSTVMWQLQYSQISSWSQGKFYINSDVPYTLVIRADIDQNAAGYIVIDDINYHTQKCSVSPFKARPLNQPSTTRIPTTITSAPSTVAPIKGSYDCTFEGYSFCNWTSSPSNPSVKWSIGRGARYGYDPFADHTSGRYFGNFAIFRYTRQRVPVTVVKLLSPPIHNYTLTCFSFWYYMYGTTMHYLSVQHMKSNGLFEQVWYHTEILARKWYPVSITLNLHENDRIAFQVDNSRYYSGTIAVDDIKLTPGHCQIRSTCGFEEDDLCGFTQANDKYSKWKVRDRNTGTIDRKILPKHDHTDETLTGHYMYVMSTASHWKSPKLLSHVQRKTTGSCVSFWYNIGGTGDYMTLIASSAINGKDYSMWSRSSRTSNKWLHVDLTVKSYTYWEIVFTALVGSHYDSHGYVAIDDVKITSGSCPMEGDCNFEDDMCTWANSKQDNFDWLQTKAANKRNGPKADHSEQNENGSYIYITPSWPIQPGEKAVLLSDPIPPTPHRRCLTFWYYMNSYSLGELRVGIQNETVLWSISGSQGTNWNFAKVPLDITTQYKTMTLTATAGHSSLAITAVDEIEFDLKPCNLYPLKAKPIITTTSAPIQTTLPPSTFKPNSKYDCAFENSLCTWVQEKSQDVFDWERINGQSGSFNTGPKVDHTFGKANGYYISARSTTNRKWKDTAMLTSAKFNENTTYTLEFYYHMFGVYGGGLNITRRLDGRPDSELLWTKSLSISRNWIKDELTLDTQIVPFTISFVATVGRYRWGYVALDDIKVFTTKQIEAPLNCTFETSGFCNFTTPHNGRYYWKKHTGISRYPSNAPSSDHTDETPYGHYMLFENPYGNNRNTTASLISPSLSSSVDMCMTFYYYLHQYRRASFRIYQISASQITKSMWSSLTNQGARWVKGQVTLEAGQNFKVKFEGILHTYGSFVGVDDISTEAGECPDPGDTDFEKDAGTWMNDRNDDLDWFRATGEMRYLMPHPPIDHTMNSTKGHYVFLASTSKSIKKGLLRSQVFPVSNVRCLHFWYYLYGQSPGGIKAYLVDEASGNKTSIWFLSSSQGTKWNPAQIAFPGYKPYYIQFEGTINGDIKVYTAIDDISFTNDYCEVKPLEAKTQFDFHPNVTTTSEPVFAKSDLECNFEKDFCKWSHNKSDVFFWRRHSGKTDSDKTGPDADHTFGNSSGTYIYIEASNKNPKDTASIISPVIPPTLNGCFRFWYHMFGPHIDTLTVYNNSGNTRSELWKRKGTIDEFWHMALIEINFNKNTQLVIEGRRGKSYYGDISVDDIAFSTKQCPSSGDNFCDFESSSICGFTQSKNDKFDWTRKRGSIFTGSSGPSTDHTFGTWQGHFMYIDTRYHRNGDNAILVSESFKSTSGKCVNFWYHTYNKQVGTLNVYLRLDDSRQLLWTRSSFQGKFWSLAHVRITVSGTFQVEFEVAVTNQDAGGISIDDFSLSEGECSKSGNVDFENGFSTWKNVDGDDFDWMIGSGIRYRRYGGPSRDHTLRNGHGNYLFLQALSPYQRGDYAVLQSEYLEGSRHRCMTFWYYMYGPGIGKLSIAIMQPDGGPNITSWALSGSQNNYWKYARVPISVNKRFQILIEGTRGSSSRVNFAIDDIFFTNTRCTLVPSSARYIPSQTTVPVTTSQPVVTTPVPTQYDCTFEKDACDWKQDKNDDFDWTRVQGPSGHYRNGPISDHTSGSRSGWYMLSKRTWKIKAFSKARIIGPNITTGKDRCLNFWYHMYGEYVNKLIANVTQNGVSNMVWMKSGDQGNLWKEAFVNLHKDTLKSDYQIIFEAVSGQNYQDYIALDDIRFTDGACHENNPTFCDFESYDKCNYTHSKNADFEWIWFSGKTPSLQTGPTADHTMGTASGHYFYIETSSKKENQTAQLLSPVYSTNNPTCLHFYYFMYGEDVNALNIYQAGAGHHDEIKTPIWIREKSQGPNWIEGTVTLAERDNFTVVFEGVSGKSYKGDIAIDDVYQTSGSCKTPGFCEFENGLCNWKNDKLDDFDWIISQGITDTTGTGPVFDHTLQNSKGHYLFIDASSPRRPGDVAHLISEHFYRSSKPACLTFWYQMYGKDVRALNVMVRKSYSILRTYDAAYLWKLSGDNGQQWFHAKVFVDKKYTQTTHQFIFEAIRGDGNYGDIAIDDISISHGDTNCEIKPTYADPEQLETEAVTCNFDRDFCEWQQDSSSKFNWTLAGYYKRVQPRTKSGSYIQMKTFPVKRTKSSLATRYLGPTSNDGNCFSFWYYMYGSNIGTLNIYFTRYGRKILIWTKSGTQTNEWNFAHMNIMNDYNYKLYVEYISNGWSTGTVALDDFFMNTNTCPQINTCDFEVNYCGWKNEQGNHNIWRRTLTNKHIPDHTTHTTSGSFLYSPLYSYMKSVKAQITSPKFPPSSISCLKFWYNMNVSSTSQLRLYVKLGPITHLIWHRTGNQGKLWWQGHANVKIPSMILGLSYKLMFESRQGPGKSELIAIDDIEHLPGPCTKQDLCDFEQGLCGFTNLHGDDFDWILFSGSQQNFATGPSADHTTNLPSGHYMYFDTRKMSQVTDKAWLSSWENEPTNATCVSFWYHMYGDGMGDLNIIYKNANMNKTILNVKGSKGNTWIQGNVTVESMTNYVIIFEGIRGKKYTSDIALDDVKFQSGTCESQPLIPTTTVAPTKQDVFFHCNFEYDLCGWQIDSTTNAEFMLSYGMWVRKHGGPTSDHTRENIFGRYLLLNNSISTTNRTARFISTELSISEPICITFWYYMRVTNFGQLNVYVHNNGENMPPLWTRVGTQGYHWQYASIDITKPEKSNKIYFEAIRNSGYYGIALDDIKILHGLCPPISECEFEDAKICGFQQGKTDKFNWTRGNFQSARFNGPPTDHTYQTNSGYYMYLNMYNKIQGDHAYLYTPQYPATQSERCLSFWYYMSGVDGDSLNVYLYRNNKITDRLWGVHTSQGAHWRLATVPINSPTQFQVLFEGIRNQRLKVIIALDDVKISQTNCAPLASCNFDDGLCGWFNNPLTIGANVNWVTKSSIFRGSHLDPKVDHTNRSPSGSYLYIKSNPSNYLKSSYLESQMIPYDDSTKYCFHFWYFLNGPNTGSLIVYTHYHGQSLNAIITKSKNTNGQWLEEYVSLDNIYKNFEMVIGSNLGNNGTIAVDDVELLKGQCPNMTEEMFVCKSGLKLPIRNVCDFIFDCPDNDDEDNCGSCTFEDDMCTWKSLSYGAFDWVRGHNGQNLYESGPTKDHTIGSTDGSYVFLHSNNGSLVRYASLQNRIIQQTSSTCLLKFWYYITRPENSDYIGVELIEGETTINLDKFRGPTKSWQQGTVEIGSVSRPFHLQFEGSRSLSKTGTVAIDDITLIDCNFPDPQPSCAKQEFQCNNLACIDSAQLCDLSNDCGDESDEELCDDFNRCDFDFGFCDWSQDTNDNFDWTRTNGNTLSFRTGPGRDHTTGTGNGYYIYTEASLPRKKGDKAQIYSPIIRPTNGNCWIRFFYHMSGHDIGELNVYTRTSMLGGYKNIWKKTGHVADYWERADIELKSTEKFQVVFEGVIGGYRSDLALDDVSFTAECVIRDTDKKLPNGTKPTQPSKMCPIGLYQCRDKSGCIQYGNLCDFQINCRDKSDEDVCGDCNFEEGFCGWQDNSTGKYKWALHQGDQMGKIGPVKDHTTDSIKGKYMRVFPAPGVFETPARLRTRPFGETAKDCSVEFYVFLSGPDIGDLNLNLINPLSGQVVQRLLSMSSDLGSNWVKKTAVIGSRQPGFSLQFESLPTLNRRAELTMETDIAIDDFKFINCNPAPIRSTTTQKTTPGKHITPSMSMKTTATPTTTPKIKPKTTPSKPGKHTTPSKPGKHTTPSKPGKHTTPSKPGMHTTPSKPGMHTMPSKPGKHTVPNKSTIKPQTSTTPVPIKCNSGEFHCQQEKGYICLPTAYRCDGNKDCIDGIDENSCKSCPQNQTYCKPQHQCIQATRCDGNIECSDGSDESLCHKCRDDFCQNGGICSIENGLPTCNCGNVTKPVNMRCVVLITEEYKQPNKKKTWAIPVGIILALIIVGALISGIYFFWKKKYWRPHTTSVTAGIDNPMYNYDFKMSEFESPSFGSSTATPGDSTAIENPLYSDLK